MKTGKVSVIITTHYIEEARQADVVSGETVVIGIKTRTHARHHARTHALWRINECYTNNKTKQPHWASYLIPSQEIMSPSVPVLLDGVN